MANGNVKVLYILSSGESGSTILGNLLGEIDSFFSAGELRFLWERGLLKRWICGCGRLVKDCSVWSAVLGNGGDDGALARFDAQTIARWQSSSVRYWHIPRMLGIKGETIPSGSPLACYISVLAKLYTSIAQITGARVIVDSSKRPSDAALLRHVPGIDPYILHLVRDPRAVAYSWSKRRSKSERHSVLRNTLVWGAWNAAGEVVRRSGDSGHSLFLRYEDFATDPLEAFKRIVKVIGEKEEKAPSPTDGRFTLGSNHTVSGNRQRFTTGMVKVSVDNRWIEAMNLRERVAATLVALPLLRRYGYPLNPLKNDQMFA